MGGTGEGVSHLHPPLVVTPSNTSRFGRQHQDSSLRHFRVCGGKASVTLVVTHVTPGSARSQRCGHCDLPMSHRSVKMFQVAQDGIRSTKGKRWQKLTTLPRTKVHGAGAGRAGHPSEPARGILKWTNIHSIQFYTRLVIQLPKTITSSVQFFQIQSHLKRA